MPILNLQQRIRELGRIRIGQKVPTAKGGTRPAKLNRFRLTSPSRPLLEKVATKYGGTVTPWQPDGGPAQFEVVTDATRIPILVPHQPVSQYYELWSGGGCQRRCDGVTELLTDRPCPCGPDPQARQCKPTTRLNVVLAEIEGIGVWRLESHGYYAALELPGVAELLSKAGGYVDAFLGLEERTAKRDGKTLRWMVPTIDVDIAPAALMAGQTSVTAVAGGPQRQAIEAGRPDYAALAAVASSPDQVGALWKQAVNAGHMNDELAAKLTARGEALKAAAAKSEAPTGAGRGVAEDHSQHAPERALNPGDYDPADQPGAVVDAEIVADDDPTEVWFQIIAAAGSRDWTTDQVEQKFAARHQGLAPASATVGQLREFLAALRKGDVA